MPRPTTPPRLCHSRYGRRQITWSFRSACSRGFDVPADQAGVAEWGEFGPKAESGFSIHAQNQRTVRGIQIQTHDVAHLLFEVRVRGDLKFLHSVRLVSKRCHTRCTMVRERPRRRARVRTLQWVSPAGLVFNVDDFHSLNGAGVLFHGDRQSFEGFLGARLAVGCLAVNGMQDADVMAFIVSIGGFYCYILCLFCSLLENNLST